MDLLKKTAVLLLAAALTAAAFSGCRKNGEPSASPAPEETTAPEAAYSVRHIIRYWPEDADYETCDYALVAEMPQFPLTETYGYAMNKAVEGYFDSLAERIETEYIPASEVKPPHTDVTCRVSQADGITNVVFSETHAYPEQPYHETRVIMLNERGEEVNLCDRFLDYHAAEDVSRALEKLISGDNRFYQKTAEEIASFIDLGHGAEATETGCRIYVREGLLAPLDEGELGFELEFADVLPKLVGEGGAFTLDEYRGLIKLLRFVTNAVIVRQDSIEDGRLTPYSACNFMGQAVTELDITPKAGRYSVDKEAFEGLYRACFGAEFPGTDENAHSIRLEDGVYSVSAKQPEYCYNVDILGTERDGDAVRINGDIMFGEFGYAYSEFVLHAAVTVEKNPESPFGWTVKSYKMSL